MVLRGNGMGLASDAVLDRCAGDRRGRQAVVEVPRSRAESRPPRALFGCWSVPAIRVRRPASVSTGRPGHQTDGRLRPSPLARLRRTAAGSLGLDLLLRAQGALPLNPDGIAGLSPDLAFNTAVSFVTNTNWQAYSGEAQLSYLSQMAGLTVPNVVSAGTGMAVGVAVIRGFVAASGAGLCTFWIDLTRSVLWILLPLSVVVTLFLAWQGVAQTLQGAVVATGVEGGEQVIARGPAAAQIAIKQLGTNGGGFFGVNAADPFENPTIASNLAQSLSILPIPVAFCVLFGRIAGDRRQGWATFAAMTVSSWRGWR